MEWLVKEVGSCREREGEALFELKGWRDDGGGDAYPIERQACGESWSSCGVFEFVACASARGRR